MIVPTQYQKLKRVRLPRKIIFKKQSGLIFIPIEPTLEHYANSINQLFGDTVNQFFQALVYPRRVKYKNAIYSSGGLEVDSYRKTEVEEAIVRHIPDYKKLVEPIYKPDMRTMVFTPPVLSKLNVSEMISKKPNVYEYFTDFYPQFIHWILYSGSSGGEGIFGRTDWTIPPLDNSNAKFIIPIRLTTKNMRLYKTIGTSQEMTKAQLRDPETVLGYSAITMLQNLLLNYEPEESKKYSLMKQKEKFVFFLHNGNVGFFLDFEELSQDTSFTETALINRFKLRVKELLMGNNGSEIESDEDDADEDISEVRKSVERENERKQKIAASEDNVRDGGSNILVNTKDQIEKKELPFDLRITQDEEEYELTQKSFEKEETENINEVPVDGEVIDAETGEVIEESANKIAQELKPKRSKADLRRIEAAKEKYKSIKLDGDKTVEEILKDSSHKVLKKERIPIETRDHSMETATVSDFDKQYIEEVMERDILAIAKSFSENKNVNLHLSDVIKTDTSTQFTEKFTYEFTFEDETGKKHKTKVDFPKIDENGFLTINGNKKILKKQFVSIPIIKIKPDMVSISSNYNKALLFRQGTVLNRNVVVAKKLINFINDVENAQVYVGKNKNDDHRTTLEYDDLSKSFHRIKLGKGSNRIVFYFNQNEIHRIMGGLEIEPPKNHLVFGIDYGKKEAISVPLEGSAPSVANIISKAIMTFHPGIESEVKDVKVPKRRIYSRLKILSRDVPLIAFLGSLYGLKKVMEVEQVQWEFVEKKIPKDRRPWIKFKDGFLYYENSPLSSSLLLNGLQELNTEIDNFSDFEEPIPYIEYLHDKHKSRNLFKGWAAFYELFLDPITLEVLADFSLPTDFMEVFLYANKLLEDNHKENEKMRFRSYESINAIFYNSMASNYRVFKQRTNAKSRKFSVQKEEIFMGLNKSFLLENYDALSPVNEMKMKSVVTYKGPQGINTDEAFTLGKRAYNDDYLGIISMSSVDSQAVGIIKHLSVNPRIKSTRGYFESLDSPEQAKTLNISELASPEELAVPFVNRHDDPKRIGFTSGQTKHVIPVVGSDPPFVGDGFEQTVVFKASNQFAKKANQDGKVIDIDKVNSAIIIELKDGTREKIEYGSQIQRNSSFFVTNELVPNVKPGQKFKKGDVLTYNKEFFHRVADRLVMTQGPMARIAILEDDTTEEDSSSITESFAGKLGTSVVNRKQITFGSQSNIIDFKRKGDYVTAGQELMRFEDFDQEDAEIAQAMQHLGEDETLSSIVLHSPETKYSGLIQDMKVFWSLPEKEMSTSVQKFIKSYKNDLMKKIKSEEELTGKPSQLRNRLEPSEPIRDRINGAIVPEGGGIVIEYYIRKETGMGVGDKLTFGSSLKSIVAQVIPDDLEPYSEFGDTAVDATMGLMSFEARMVTSPYFNGILAKMLYEKGREIANEYLKE